MYCVWYIHIHYVRYVCIRIYIYTHKYVYIYIFILIYRCIYIYMSKSQRWFRFVWLTCKTHFVYNSVEALHTPPKTNTEQNLKLPPSKRKNIYKPPIFGFYVSLGGCSLAGIFIPKWSPASAIQPSFLLKASWFSWKKNDPVIQDQLIHLASLKLTVRTWNTGVGRWLSFLGRPLVSGSVT